MAGFTDTIDLFEYLCIRIKQIGVHSVHGLPGDFNLVALDYVEKCGLRWVGNCNELNAGYAADGYARVNGIAALMTVMGVGELSAINAIAGSFAEQVPVIHIVAKPSLQAQQNQLCLHHSLGDGNFGHFEEMTGNVYCATASIDCAQKAPALIDNVIQSCWVQSRPVCITIPTDMVRAPIALNRLSDRGLERMMFGNDMLQHEELVDTIIQEIQQAQNPVILVGGYGVFHGVQKQLNGFLSSLRLPVLAAASGLSLATTCPYYAGLYAGSISDQNVLELIQNASLVIEIGNIQSDLSTSGFSGKLDSQKLIEIERTKAKVKGRCFEDVRINSLLAALTVKLQSSAISVTGSASAYTDGTQEHNPTKTDTKIPLPKMNHDSDTLRDLETPIQDLCSTNPLKTEGLCKEHKPITHNWFWGHLGDWLRKGDIILAEAGTASFGIWDTAFPPDTILLAQYLWSSIGYTIGACQGAALAVRDSTKPQRRTILFIGDGSFQCGCQELSTIVRHGLAPIIFIICNSGYTVERLIHGETQVYNDIQPWNHRLLPLAFGAAPGSFQTHRVETREQLGTLWSHESFQNCSCLQVIELCVAQDDAPSNLVTLAQSLQKRNK